MSSGFISEAEIAAQKQKRQEEWEKVRQPDEPIECEEAPYDPRSLYEKLKEQKDKKDYEYEEAHKLKNLIRGLDDDEVDFLHVVDKAKANAEHKQHLEESKELQEFREQRREIEAQSLDNKIQAEIAKPKTPAQKLNTRPTQKSILSGMVRKRPASDAAGASSSSSSVAVSSSSSSASSHHSNQTTSSNTMETNATTDSPPKTNADDASTPGAATAAAAPNTATTAQQQQQPLSTPATVGLRCIGVLPGLGKYDDSSDSDDNSSDSDDAEDASGHFDFLGRAHKMKKCEDAQHEH